MPVATVDVKLCQDILIGHYCLLIPGQLFPHKPTMWRFLYFYKCLHLKVCDHEVGWSICSAHFWSRSGNDCTQKESACPPSPPIHVRLIDGQVDTWWESWWWWDDNAGGGGGGGGGDGGDGGWAITIQPHIDWMIIYPAIIHLHTHTTPLWDEGVWIEEAGGGDRSQEIVQQHGKLCVSGVMRFDYNEGRENVQGIFCQ